MYSRSLSFPLSRTSSRSTNINQLLSSPPFLLYVPHLHRFYTTPSTSNAPPAEVDEQSQATPPRPQGILVLPPKSKTPSFARKPKPGSRSIWKSPISPGKIPAYDEALKYIRTDARKLSREARELASIIKSREAELKAANNTPSKNVEINELRQKLEILQIQSRINLPEVRFAFKMGRCTFLVLNTRVVLLLIVVLHPQTASTNPYSGT